MPVYKLYYFDGRGRGESIRQLLKLAGQPFEDIRVTAEDWPTFKPKMPLNQMPVLEVDGVMIAPTQTIHRFIGNEFGLNGTTALENAKLDMIAEVVQDLSSHPGPNWFGMTLFGANPEYPKDQVKQYFKDKIRPAIDKFAPLIEKFLLESGNSGLFLGDKETWVDVFAAEQFSKFIDYGESEYLDAYPRIKALIARIHAHPAISRHIIDRPFCIA